MTQMCNLEGEKLRVFSQFRSAFAKILECTAGLIYRRRGAVSYGACTIHVFIGNSSSERTGPASHKFVSEGKYGWLGVFSQFMGWPAVPLRPGSAVESQRNPSRSTVLKVSG